MTANTDVTNHDRAAWANAALYLFGQLTGCDHEDALGDLLCDLMHWSGEHDFDFTAELDRARGHYEAEVLEELPLPPDRLAAALAPPVPFLLDVLDHVRATLKLRHLDEATDEEVEEALRMADSASLLAKGGAQ